MKLFVDFLAYNLNKTKNGASMRLYKKIESRGEFWIPGKKKNRLYGTLIIEDGGKISLETNQLFEGVAYNDDISRVVGYFEDGVSVILENGFYLKYPIFHTLKADTKIFFHKAYLGLKYTGIQQIKFAELHFSFEGIASWQHSDFFRTDIHKTLPNPVKIFKQHQSPYNYDFESGVHLEVKPYTSFHLDQQKLEMEGSLSFKLVAEKQANLNLYLEHIKTISTFINFCTQRHNNLTNVKGIVERDRLNSDLDLIEIYYQSIFFYPRPSKKDLESLLNFEHILSENNLFERWVKLLAETYPSIQLYLTSILSDHKYLESRYLALTQAFEIFHRGLFNDFSPENEGKIFMDRLKEILEPIRAYLGSGKKIKSFLGYVKETRDELTHTGRLDKIVRDKKYNLYNLIDILESVFTILLLYHLGLPEQEIKKILNRSLICTPLL